MAYGTATDVLLLVKTARLTQLADLDNSGAYDVATVDRALAEAYETINMYLGQRYPVPLVTCPDSVKSWESWIALYILVRNALIVDVPDTVKAEYDRIIALLEKIAKGDLVLPGAAIDTTPTVAGSVQSSAEDRIFGPTSIT